MNGKIFLSDDLPALSSQSHVHGITLYNKTCIQGEPYHIALTLIFKNKIQTKYKISIEYLISSPWGFGQFIQKSVYI